MGARLGSSRAPWRALFALEVARDGSFSRDRFPPSQSRPGPWKPHNFSKILALLLLYHTVPPAWKFVSEFRYYFMRLYHIMSNMSVRSPMLEVDSVVAV